MGGAVLSDPGGCRRTELVRHYKNYDQPMANNNCKNAIKRFKLHVCVEAIQPEIVYTFGCAATCAVLNEFMGANDLLRRIRRLARNRGVVLKEEWGKGSHLKLWLDGRRTVIPFHGSDIPTGTFHAIKKDLGLSDAELDV